MIKTVMKQQKSKMTEFCRDILNSAKPKSDDIYESILGQKMRETSNVVQQQISENAHRVVQCVKDLDLEPVNNRLLFHLAYRHLLALPINCFSEKITLCKGLLNRYMIYDLIPMFNHSCDTNLDHFINEENIHHCVATKSIKKSSQLFINYVLGQKFNSGQERRQYIYDNWNFWCNCDKCTRDLSVTPP